MIFYLVCVLTMGYLHQQSNKKDKIIYNYNNPIHDIVYEINLSLVYKKEIKSRISLASYSYNSDRAFYLNSQYYYFDASGDIYIISFKEYGENIKDINNIHYKIDKDNLKFIKLWWLKIKSTTQNLIAITIYDFIGWKRSKHKRLNLSN